MLVERRTRTWSCVSFQTGEVDDYTIGKSLLDLTSREHVLCFEKTGFAIVDVASVKIV